MITFYPGKCANLIKTYFIKKTLIKALNYLTQSKVQESKLDIIIVIYQPKYLSIESLLIYKMSYHGPDDLRLGRGRPYEIQIRKK